MAGTNLQLPDEQDFKTDETTATATDLHPLQATFNIIVKQSLQQACEC
jgi:hypothetical protein